MKIQEGMKAIRRLPLFPLIPLLPIALVGSCTVLGVLNYRRLRRLEQRWGERQPRVGEEPAGISDRPRLRPTGGNARQPVSP